MEWVILQVQEACEISYSHPPLFLALSTLHPRSQCSIPLIVMEVSRFVEGLDSSPPPRKAHILLTRFIIIPEGENKIFEIECQMAKRR